MIRNTELPLCTKSSNNVSGQLYFTNKLTEKEIRVKDWGEGELDEGGQELQTSIHKMGTKDAMYNII